MYQLIVKRISRGFWGPKHKTILTKTSPYVEEVMAEASKYQTNPNYKVIFRDFVEMYGDFDDRPINDEPTAWDLHGNPVDDERGKEARKDAQREAQYQELIKDDIPF